MAWIQSWGLCSFGAAINWGKCNEHLLLAFWLCLCVGFWLWSWGLCPLAYLCVGLYHKIPNECALVFGGATLLMGKSRVSHTHTHGFIQRCILLGTGSQDIGIGQSSGIFQERLSDRDGLADLTKLWSVDFFWSKSHCTWANYTAISMEHWFCNLVGCSAAIPVENNRCWPRIMINGSLPLLSWDFSEAIWHCPSDAGVFQTGSLLSSSHRWQWTAARTPGVVHDDVPWVG